MVMYSYIYVRSLSTQIMMNFNFIFFLNYPMQNFLAILFRVSLAFCLLQYVIQKEVIRNFLFYEFQLRHETQAATVNKMLKLSIKQLYCWFANFLAYNTDLNDHPKSKWLRDPEAVIEATHKGSNFRHP